MESPITIRRAMLADAGPIAEVHVRSWRSTYPGIVDQVYIDSLSVTEREAAWARRLNPANEAAPDIFVATTPDRRVVGFVCGGLIREPFESFDAELHALYLEETVQRAGVGRRLVRECAAAASTRGLSRLIVRVLARNPACAFYERLGAERLRETELLIRGRPYLEHWYGWRSLDALTA